MDDKVVSRFENFISNVAILENTRFYKSGMQAGLNIKGDSASASLNISNPDEDDLRSFLVTFRKFISSSEPSFFDRVMNDTIRFMQDDIIRDELIKGKEIWNNTFRKKGAFPLKVNAQEISAAHILDLWINGIYFHDDKSKKEDLLNLMKNSLTLVRFQMLTALPAMTGVLLVTRNIIINGLENGSFTSKE